MKSHKRNNLLILFILCAIAYTVYAHPTHWRQLTPGVEYSLIRPSFGFPLGRIHAFRINVQNTYFDLGLTEENDGLPKSLDHYVANQKNLIASNGGFFNANYRPLGLRIKNSTIISPLKPISWWGIFLINDNHPYIINQANIAQFKNINFAIQSGPRLIINGQIPKLKPGLDNRTALGITSKGQVILLVTENLPISTYQLAKIMQAPAAKGGLDCINALNLDGGNSSQLYAVVNDFHLKIASLTPLTDVLLIKMRPLETQEPK